MGKCINVVNQPKYCHFSVIAIISCYCIGKTCRTCCTCAYIHYNLLHNEAEVENNQLNQNNFAHSCSIIWHVVRQRNKLFVVFLLFLGFIFGVISYQKAKISKHGLPEGVGHIPRRPEVALRLPMVPEDLRETIFGRVGFPVWGHWVSILETCWRFLLSSFRSGGSPNRSRAILDDFALLFRCEMIPKM